MYCQEVCLVSTRLFSVTRHEGQDYLQGSPLRVRLNPLRYQLGIGRPGRRRYVNLGGRWNRQVSNLAWCLWGRRCWERDYRRRTGQPWHD